jgi:hypothetical protein
MKFYVKNDRFQIYYEFICTFDDLFYDYGAEGKSVK